jgi:hypothetical protein
MSTRGTAAPWRCVAPRPQAVREAAFAALAGWMGYREGPAAAGAEGSGQVAEAAAAGAYVPALLPLLLIGGAVGRVGERSGPWPCGHSWALMVLPAVGGQSALGSACGKSGR